MTDFSLVTQLDGSTEPDQIVFFDHAEVIKLRGSTVDWIVFFQPYVARRIRHGTKQLLGQREYPHLDEK